MANHTLHCLVGRFELTFQTDYSVPASGGDFTFTGFASYRHRLMFARPGVFVLTGKDGLATYFLHPEVAAFTLGTPAVTLARTDWNPVVAQQPVSRKGGVLYAIVNRTVR